EPGEDIRRGWGQDDLPKDAPTGQAEGPAGIDQGLFDMPHAIDCVYQDGPGARIYRHGHDHPIADAEQQYGNRNNRYGGHGPQELDQHFQQTVSEAKITEDNSESHRKRRGEKITF